MTPDKANQTGKQWGIGALVALLCAGVLATFFSGGQAVTFAWLSGFPEQASRLEVLQWKFWSYAALSLVLFVVDLRLVWLLLQRVLHRIKHGIPQP